MVSAYFSASIPAVHALGQRLREIASTVVSGAVFPGATGAEAYEDLTSAVGDFKADWENAVARLEEKTRGLGETTTAAATTMAEHDAGLAPPTRAASPGKEQPMGTRFSITGDAVNRHAGNLDGSVADLNANLQQFINALAGLPGVWRGAAFQSFDQLQQRWEQASRQLNLALADIRGRVGEAGTLYDQYHADQQATIGRAAGAAAAWDATRFTG